LTQIFLAPGAALVIYALVNVAAMAGGAWFGREDSKAELNDVAKWRAAGSIEGGGTRAFVNASP
jgi:hypothetical protein